MKQKKFMLLLFLLCAFGAPRADAGNADFVTVLTADKIQAFLEESRNLAVGRDIATAQEDITRYFQNHLAEKGVFKSKTRYELPGFPAQEGEMKLNKEEYIAYVIEGRDLLEDYRTTIEVRAIEISGSGRSATIQTTSTERGKMPWVDEQGNPALIPIDGVSDCEQRLVVSPANYIQLAQADCNTLISFSPFGDTPLGE